MEEGLALTKVTSPRQLSGVGVGGVRNKKIQMQSLLSLRPQL